MLILKLFAVYTFFICMCTLLANKDAKDGKIIAAIVFPMLLQCILTVFL